MSILEYTLESIEKNLDGYLRSEKILRKQGIKGGAFPESEKIDGNKYKERKEKIPYSMFIHQADYHYFVSRVLFINRVYQYALFVGQQCIENYLKALLNINQINFLIPTIWLPLRINAEKYIQMIILGLYTVNI